MNTALLSADPPAFQATALAPLPSSEINTSTPAIPSPITTGMPPESPAYRHAVKTCSIMPLRLSLLSARPRSALVGSGR